MQIKSFEEFVRYIESLKGKYMFRGQADKEWDITPSIFRSKNIELLNNEAKTVIKADINNDNDAIINIFRLQHEGTPTRLLDLTINALSALYFSVDNDDEKDKDGVVYVIDKIETIEITSKEIELFSRALKLETFRPEDLVNDEFSIDEIVSILTKDYIIKYNYNFSYTNQRAILQGGTAVLFGFGYENGEFQRKSKRNIEHLIVEKIIIPLHIKMDLKTELARLGYIKEILYHDFENISYSEEIFLTKNKFEVYNKARFNKIIAQYRVNTIEFNRDGITRAIEKIYTNLFNRYGYNARIFLSIFLDDEDEAAGNYICKTDWSNDYPYTIAWKEDYYKRRMSYLNEQISEVEVKKRFDTFIANSKKINDDLVEIASRKDYSLSELLEKAINNKAIPVNYNDIPMGNSNVEKFAKAAIKYIADVQTLLDEIILHSNRQEKENIIKYYVKISMEDCIKSRSRLDEIYLSQS